MIGHRVHRVLSAAFFTAVCAALGSSPLRAQQTGAPPKPTRCTLVEQPSTRIFSDSTATGNVLNFGGGVHFRCPSRSIELRGDSAERFNDHDALIGNAVFDDPRVHVTSDFLNYFPDSEKVVAVGNVHVRTPSGSTLVGPIAVYYRAAPRIRTRALISAKARPLITVVEKDSAGRPTEPMTVLADSVLMDGDSLIYGRGQVVITRPQITATADSVFVDETKETMRLMRGPELKGNKERPFSLKGDVIDLYSTNRKPQRVIARGSGIAVSDSLTLKSDTIDLRLKNDVLDHAYVWGSKSRARAVSPTQNILADSLDVTMPGQQIRLVHALGKAFAQGKPDTARFTVEKGDSTDWIRGDTIIAHFDSVPPKAATAAKDTSKGPRINQLIATGHASAWYHMAASDTAERRPAINYTSARTITVDFSPQPPPSKGPPGAKQSAPQNAPQKVATVTAKDSVNGVFIEPGKADSTRRSAGAPADKGPPKPATKEQPKPATNEPPKPATSEPPRPATKELPKPAIKEEPKPAIPASVVPLPPKRPP